MPLVSRPIPSLLNGISQQPPSLRRASQAELQVNCYSDLAEGLVKRPPLQHVDHLSASKMGDIHTSIVRDDNDHWILVLKDNVAPEMYRVDDGTKATMNTPAGVAYLNCTDPVTDFATTSVEDVTYVVNREIVTAEAGTTATGTYIGEVQDWASLPGAPAPNDVHKIVGDDSVFLTGYYVKWNATTSVWEECAYPGTTIALSATTMPHKIIKTGASTFQFNSETWTARAAGDTTSLPIPNFVGRAISDVFHYRNRLGVVAGEYVNMSQAGPDYTNWYAQTATDILDNDRIDVRAVDMQESIINFAVPMNRQLVLFTDSAQFIIGTNQGQLLTPKTAAADIATHYSANAVAQPLQAGRSVFFTSENTLFSTIREYYVAGDNEVSNSADDITAHCPNYVPSGVIKMAHAENDDTIFVLTTGSQNRVYVYKYFYVEDEKVQASWSYWEIEEDFIIRSLDVVGSTLYMIIDSNHATGGCDLVKVDLNDDDSRLDLGFTCHLDYRIKVAPLSYDAVADETTFTMSYSLKSGTPVNIVKSGDFTSSYGALVPNATTHPSIATSLVAPGDWMDGGSGNKYYLGMKYTKHYRFSEIFVREGNNPESGTPVLDANLTVRTMSLRYSNTGYLKAEVVPRPGASSYKYIFSGKKLGSIDLVIGTPNISTGTFKFPIGANSSRVTIDITNDSHMPSAVVSAEWNGNYNLKAGRRG
jgi:hypothetical protein